jgi:hypothetical protein
MRLLNVDTLTLHTFVGTNIPTYAILSHTWGPEEILFEDITQYRDGATLKKGWAKVKGCCEKAAIDDFHWVWIDTCCIDKSSSTELSEAINSMFQWYQRAGICYAYLEDISQIRPKEKPRLARLRDRYSRLQSTTKCPY